MRCSDAETLVAEARAPCGRFNTMWVWAVPVAWPWPQKGEQGHRGR